MSSNGSKQCYVSTFRIQLKPPSVSAAARNGPEPAGIWTSEKRPDTGEWWEGGREGGKLAPTVFFFVNPGLKAFYPRIHCTKLRSALNTVNVEFGWRPQQRSAVM